MVTPTAAQLAIRDHPGLALLVVAPAGCGKTEALALRVAGLVERQIVSHPRRVLVTTFSNRARDNIRDRLASYLSPGALRDRVSVTNFHGLSARLIRAHANVIGLSPQLELPESDWVREQCLSRKWGWDQTIPAENALRKVKQQPLDDDQVRAVLVEQNAWDAVELEDQRRSEGRLTYDDLPRLAELILANDTVAQLYKNHFAAVIVDEFQDLTPQQLRIINRIGLGKTTFAGDLAQGIYGFAGAQPAAVDAAVRAECPDVIEFTESHRSSPAVLEMVNALNGLTGGLKLTSARPESWPSGGLAGAVRFNTPVDEANWAMWFAGTILQHAPNQRIGIIGRTAPRRETVDAVAAQSGLTYFRWDDGVLDTDTAQIVKGMLLRIRGDEVLAADDPLDRLRRASDLAKLTEADTRRALVNALVWCLDQLRDGASPSDVRDRIRVGDQDTLLTAAGVHLLTGHAGKGQQFDWVVIVGAEDGVVPDFRSKTAAARQEDARVLSVMLSRARHGVVVTCAASVPDKYGRAWAKEPSRFFTELGNANFVNDAAVHTFLEQVDWPLVSAR